MDAEYEIDKAGAIGPESVVGVLDVYRLRLAIDRLPLRYRQLITYYYLHEMYEADVGAMLGISHQAVSQQLPNAIIALRKALTGDRSPVGVGQ